MKKKSWDYKVLFRRLFLLSYDVVAVGCASILALALRMEFDFLNMEIDYLSMILKYLPINIITTLAVFYLFRLYHSLWAFAGVTEMQNIATACIVTSFIQLVGMQMMSLQPPRSYYFIYGLLLVCMTVISRFIYRFLRMLRRKNRMEKDSIHTMIIGAGEAGNMIIKEIMK